jgi:hypothetical protein
MSEVFAVFSLSQINTGMKNEIRILKPFTIVYISLLINNPARSIHLLCGTDKIVS